MSLLGHNSIIREGTSVFSIFAADSSLCFDLSCLNFANYRFRLRSILSYLFMHTSIYLPINLFTEHLFSATWRHWDESPKE